MDTSNAAPSFYKIHRHVHACQQNSKHQRPVHIIFQMTLQLDFFFINFSYINADIFTQLLRPHTYTECIIALFYLFTIRFRHESSFRRIKAGFLSVIRCFLEKFRHISGHFYPEIQVLITLSSPHICPILLCCHLNLNHCPLLF